MTKQILLFFFLFFSTNVLLSQEKEETEKMIRDVVNVEVERAKYAPKPAPTPAPVVDPKKKKKHVEEVPVETPLDTLPPNMPAPAAEILKRAQHWYTLKAKKFVKANGGNTGKSVTCNVTFIYKQKILNPENEVDGKITMDVIIDAKEGKYRYTIKNIKHKANKQGMSGGDVYGIVPECGSMSVTDRTWKQIKTEAFNDAQLVIEDFKAIIKQEVNENKDDW